MVGTDYWLDLSEKCRGSKRERFNYIMSLIDSKSPPQTGNVTVNVTDSGGEGISGAECSIYSDYSLVWEGITTEEGICTSDNLPVGNYTILITADDYIRFVESFDVVKGDNTFNFTLVDCGVIHVTVTTDATEEISLADFHVTVEDHPECHAFTDSEGTCDITDVPIGDYTIRISKSEFETHESELTVVKGDNTYTACLHYTPDVPPK